MKFSEFLDLIKVVKMLYGRDIAEQLFKKNIDEYYKLNYADLSASVQKQESTE